jgi:hypothetical protein
MVIILVAQLVNDEKTLMHAFKVHGTRDRSIPYHAIYFSFKQ